TVLQSTPPTPGVPTVPNPPGTMVNAFDQFSTRNQFYGGQVGAAGGWKFGRFFVDLTGEVAMGGTHQEEELIRQATVVGRGVAPQVFLGDLLTSPLTNIGSHHKDEFSVVPELTLNVGYQVTPGLRVFAGYTFLYWSNVVRPGQQVDTFVDPALVPQQGT